MLLYSTMFPVKEDLDKDAFIKLAIEWNQGSPSDKMENLNWDGETKNIRFLDNNNKMSFEIVELRAHNTIAIRFKKEEDGLWWTTDYILNFNDHLLSIRLDRMITNDAIFVSKSQPPYFVKMVIQKNYSGNDNELSIDDTYHSIDKDNYKLVEDIILGKRIFQLPVIYVTKNLSGNYPLSIDILSRKLQGVAHVLVENNHEVSQILKESCNCRNPYNGYIGLYFPGNKSRSRLMNPKRFEQQGDDIIYRITQNIYRYMTQQACPVLYTWDGIQQELYKLKYESNRKKKINAEKENAAWIENFDIEINKLQNENEEQQNKIQELNNQIASLNAEIRGLRSKYSTTNEVPLIYHGEEIEFYSGEIKEIVLDILSNQLRIEPENTRRNHILTDIINGNDFKGIPDIRKEKIKKF